MMYIIQTKNKREEWYRLDRNSYILFSLTNGIDRKSSLHLKHINEGEKNYIKNFV